MEEINQNANPMPQMTPEQPPQGFDFKGFFRENKWSAWLILGSVVLIALAAYLAFRKPANNQPTQPKVAVSIDAPEKISSGSEIVYKVLVKNSDSSTIKNITIDMIYPNGFSYEDATPKPIKLNGSQFALPNLDPSQDTTIMIKGTILGNAGETKAVAATMHYRLDNFNSDFVAQGQAQTEIMTANVALEFDGPASAAASQPLTYTLNYANFTDKPISGLKITLGIPSSFKLSGTDPNPVSGNVWNIGNLDANGEGKIVLNGAFQNAAGGDQENFSASAEGSIDGKPSVVLSTGQLQVVIAAIPLEAAINLAPTSMGTADIAAPGDNLAYTIKYQNNGSDPAHAVIISAKLDGEGYDLNNITAAGANVSGNTITWDASQNSALETLAAGDGGTLTFNVPVLEPATRSNDKNLTLSAHTEIKSSDYQKPFVSANVSSKIQTEVAVSGSSAAVSANTYNVTITLKNETNEVDSAKMVMNLPNAANFGTASVSLTERGNVSYDAGTKKLTWNVDKLAAHTGSFVPVRKLQFTVILAPGGGAQSQVLASNIKFTGIDSFTNQAVEVSASPVTIPQ